MFAGASVPFVNQSVEIDGDSYCEGSIIDTMNFKTLLQDHSDLDEIWIIRIGDAQKYRKPENLHDACGNLCQLYEATLAESDVKLFKYHLKQDDKWHGRIVEIQINSDVTFDWSHSNLGRARRRGKLAAEKTCASYAPKPSFFFALEGEGARCDEVLWGSAFDLVFRYDVLPEDTLAALKGEYLRMLVKSKTSARLDIDVIPKGLTLTEGSASRVVSFEDGRMVAEPPRFRLKAPEKDADTGPAQRGVYVIFTIRGAVVYDFFLEIRLVERLAVGPLTTRVLDLDLEEVGDIRVEEPRAARLGILSEGGSWLVYGNIDGVERTPERTMLVNDAKLDAAYRGGILNDLARIAGQAVWRSIDDKLEISASEEEAARECMRMAVTAGSKLYRHLSEDRVLKEVLDRIDRLPEGSKITVMTNATAFPWELFYPLEYVYDYPSENYRPERFWGNRFLFESLLFPTTDEEKPPKLRRQLGKLHVSMGLDATIDAEWVDRPLLPVGLHKDYFESALRSYGDYYDRYDDIIDVLRRPHPASMIYFFCHGTADELQFDKTKPVCTAAHVMGSSYPGWPIVFMNACSAGNISPLSFFSFRREFRKKKTAGIIAPSFPIPTLFAALFAKTLIARYVDRQPIGQTLFNLRRELLAKNNPLGLWYSLQCHLDVTAPER
jgi:hypothetical protein